MKLKPFKSETLTPESSPLKVPDQSDDADLTIDQSDVNLTMDDLGIYIYILHIFCSYILTPFQNL